MALAIAGISIVVTLIAAAVLHFREREANKNGNGLENLKRLIEK
jgi:hypothetical protein